MPIFKDILISISSVRVRKEAEQKNLSKAFEAAKKSTPTCTVCLKPMFPLLFPFENNAELNNLGFSNN